MYVEGRKKRFVTSICSVAVIGAMSKGRVSRPLVSTVMMFNRHRFSRIDMGKYTMVPLGVHEVRNQLG